MDPRNGATDAGSGDRTRGTAQDILHMTTGVCLLMLWPEAGAFVNWDFWQPQQLFAFAHFFPSSCAQRLVTK